MDFGQGCFTYFVNDPFLLSFYNDPLILNATNGKILNMLRMLL